MRGLDFLSNLLTRYGFEATHTVATADVATDPANALTPQVLGVATKQLTVIGDWDEPWVNEQEEIDMIRGKKWFPAELDFVAVVQNSHWAAIGGDVPMVDSSKSFIHFILDQAPGSISRLNIVTHGTSGSVGLKGKIIREKIKPDGTVEPANVDFEKEIDAGELSNLLENGIDYKGRTLKWSEVERRFADNAEIVIYACNTALNQSFMQDIADFFDVRVRGFTRKLHFDYDETALAGEVLRRQLITVDGVEGLDKLKPDVVKTPVLKNPFK